MNRLIEHDIIQNIGIGALALFKFTKSYYKTTEKLKGPLLQISMPVLPLLYHTDSLENIYHRNYKGGFFTAINEYRELPAGLQQRMEDMSEQTFKSLSLAFQSKLLTYNKEFNEIIPIEKDVKTDHYDVQIKKIISGSERLGVWFAMLPFDQICINLKIKY